jgi:hypothetical protein
MLLWPDPRPTDQDQELQPDGGEKANWMKMLNDLEDITGLSDGMDN